MRVWEGYRWNFLRQKGKIKVRLSYEKGTVKYLKRKKKRKERSLAGEILSWLLYLFIILAVIFLLLHFIGQKKQVQGMSMSPALDEGDSIIVDRLSYRFRDPGRFDVVVFQPRFANEASYIKRVIGLPGETVQIVDGQVYINGQLLQGDMGWEPIESAGLASDPVILNEDEYFVLGDNRNDSSDSRVPSVGNVAESSIIGRAWFRIWPMSRIGLIE